jgi:hypothetical protein
MTVPVAGTGYVVNDGRVGEIAFGSMGAPQTATTAATLTAAQILGGVLEGSAGTSGVNYTLPAYTVLEAAIENPRVNMCFDLTIINLGTSSGVITLVTGTGFTLVGMATLPITTSAGSSGTWRFRKTGATTWSVYRIS